jgi:hypothetical protein
MTLPLNALIFMFDTVPMCTNMDTEECITHIEEYLLHLNMHYQFHPKNPHTIIDAMSLVMRNNRLQFRDLVIHQMKELAMEMSPAPTIVYIFFAILNEEHSVLIIEMYVRFLHCFIDVSFGIWIHDLNPSANDNNWQSFQMIVNPMGLTWELTSCCQKVTFMDLNIKIEDRWFVTLLYAKPMVLYL